MSTQQAKRLSLPEILEKLGHRPLRSAKDGHEFWYLSPFGNERATASFHTSFLGGRWIWKDFEGGGGGNVLDFAMCHQNTSDLKKALAFLDSLSLTMPVLSKNEPPRLAPPADAPAISPEKTDGKNQPGKTPGDLHGQKTLIFDSSRPLQTTVSYIQERGIDLGTAKKYLVEVFFHNVQTGKPYYAAGMRNRSGGHEIRNPYFQSTVGPKDITFVRGRVGESVGVFEGFLDFLSHLTDIRFEELEKDTIILNSAAIEKNALDFIKSKGYKRVHLFFDNDKAGDALTEHFIEALENTEVRPENHRYHPHKDYNAMLVARLKNLKK